MADYRALAQALDPYAMDTGGITPDTLRTLQSGYKSPNLLGMIGDIGRGGLSNLESLVRGGVAQVPGTAGDLETLGRMGLNASFGAGGVKVSPKAVMPTTTDILGMMPQRVTQARPETASMEELGTMIAPGLAKAAAPVGKGYLSLLGNEINAGMTGQPTRSVVGQITPKPLQLDVSHGTPHKLPSTQTNPLGEFDANKIGTGAGAQARGYGIYLSESPEFADYFAIKKGVPDLEGIALQNGIELSKDARIELMRQATRDSAGKPTKGDNYIDPVAAVRKLQSASIEARKLPVDKLQNTIQEFQNQNKAYLYKADLPDEMIPKMLDLDKPIKDQPTALNAIRSMIDDADILKTFDHNVSKGITGENAAINYVSGKTPAQKSEALRKAGIPGSVYKELDIRNFVVFPGEEKNVKILERQNR